MTTFTSKSLRLRRATIATLDALAWIVALTACTLLRWEGAVDKSLSLSLLALIIVAIVAMVAFGSLSLYRFTWRTGSFEEFTSLTATVAAVSVVVVFVDMVSMRSSVPLSAAVGGCSVAYVLMIGGRGAWRASHRFQARQHPGVARAIIMGAGDAGQRTITLLTTDSDPPFVPVALLDDDPAKAMVQHRHLRVSGNRHAIATTAAATGATALILAIPRGDPETFRELTELGEAAGLEVSILPTVAYLTRSPLRNTDIKPISEMDLLGRRSVETKVDEIAGYLTGRRVLVTGAGGSIGSELCRQIARFGPSSLIMLDHDESGLHAVELSLHGRAMLDTRNVVVCDIRDPGAIGDVFREHAPEVIFHAAALKHLPLLEMYPAEGFKSNVVGTLNVLRAAAALGVSTFVNISTDKAANPTSVLGLSKRVAERLTTSFGATSPSSTFVSVRFGNVLGSRGSVLQAFAAQIEQGGPITVTHPEVTRYFMTIEEAVQLVIQAGAIGGEGALILDMGTPVKIDDVAHRLAGNADTPIEIVYTGLRAGEKMHEELIGYDETAVATTHPLITRASVPALDPALIDRTEAAVDGRATAGTLAALADPSLRSAEGVESSPFGS